MNFRKLVLAAVALFGLTACLETTQTPVGTAPSIAASATVGPGSRLVDPVMASNLFRVVCIDSLPRFANAPSVISTMPFTLNTRTQIYYHNSMNLSFKVFRESGDSICSMVFFTSASQSVTAATMAPALNTSPRPVTARITEQGDGTTIVNIKLIN